MTKLTRIRRCLTVWLSLIWIAAALSPAQARFITPDTWDPWIAGVDINRYAYGGNDPINSRDPTGHNGDPSYHYDPDSCTGACAAGAVEELNNFQSGLSATGMAQGPIGSAADILNGSIDIARGNYGDAAINLGSAIPFADGLKLNNAIKRVPNPWGKRGDPTTQARVTQIEKEIRARGNIPVTERRFDITNGHKKVRYVDVAEYDKAGNLLRLHQVGVKTKKGEPISRERKAMDDINRTTQMQTEFHDKFGKGPTGDGASSVSNSSSGKLGSDTWSER